MRAINICKHLTNFGGSLILSRNGSTLSSTMVTISPKISTHKYLSEVILGTDVRIVFGRNNSFVCSLLTVLPDNILDISVKRIRPFPID